MAISKAQSASVQKYTAKHYDQVKFMVKKGKRDEIKAYAAKNGESVNGYLNRLIQEDMEKHQNDDTATEPESHDTPEAE